MKFIFAIILASTVISIACSASKSAGPSTVPSSPTQEQVSTQPSASAQAPQEKACNLQTTELPALNGLKLGMTPDEVLALFPGSKDDTELRPQLSQPAGRFGTSSFLIKPAKYQSKENFAGINQVTFSFLDGRLSNFILGYSGPAYAHVDKFVEKFVEGKDLPTANLWEAYPGLDTQMKTLVCKDFEIRVSVGGEGGSLNYVLVNDLVGETTLRDRRKKAREQASPTPGNQ